MILCIDLSQFYQVGCFLQNNFIYQIISCIVLFFVLHCDVQNLGEILNKKYSSRTAAEIKYSTRKCYFVRFDVISPLFLLDMDLIKEMLQTLAEHAVSYRAGQTTLRYIDRALWVVEKCARWAVPPPCELLFAKLCHLQAVLLSHYEHGYRVRSRQFFHGHITNF